MANYNSNYTGQDLDKAIKLALGSLAEDFSTSKTYAIGDLAIYQGDLYKCIAAHTGAWNDAHFERIDLAEAIKQGGKVTGVKGNAETDYRTGDVNLTPANIGAEPADATILKQADVVNDLTHTDTNKPLSANQGKELKTLVDGKQETLVSGTNIKTLNNESLLGSGNIDINGAVWGNITGTLSSQTDLQSALDAKQNDLSFSIIDGQVCITYEA